MPEVIANYVKPIAIIPPQQLLAGRVAELRQKLARQRAQASKEQVALELAAAIKQLNDCLVKLGREPI